MQINGLTNYTAHITSITRTTQGPILNANSNDLRDSVSISELGQRLSISRGHKLTGGASSIKEAASLMSKSLSSYEKTLERMNELTHKAAKDDLTTLDRLNMQIEFEELREKLAGASGELNEGLAKLFGLTDDREAEPVAETQTVGDTRKLLERARDRLLNGEDWDIAERWEDTGEVDSKGEYIITGGEWVRDDSKDAPTVHDKIRASGTVDLMSSKSAKKGIDRIEDELANVKDMRDRFSSFLMSYNGDDLGGWVKLSDLPTEQQADGFDTPLGIMHKIDKITFTLDRPTNQMGYMFVRIDDMFRSTASKLAGDVISES